MALGDVLSRSLVELVNALSWPIDLIVPVPSGRARRQQRGYNQAALLAFPLALCAGSRYHSRALLKKRETPSQVGLNPEERKRNVAGAFIAVRQYVVGKNVLVVDDVATTGATLTACAQALLEGGSSSVYGLTLARVDPTQ